MGGLTPWILAIGLCAALGCSTSHSVRRAGDKTVHTFRISYNNVHAIVTPTRVILIDAGLHGDAETLLEELAEQGVDRSAITAVVLTHGHADHAGGANRIRALTGASIIAGAGDRAMLAAGRNDTLCPTDDRARSDVAEHQAHTYPGFAADHWIPAESGSTTPLGLPIQVASVPGHTPGSVVVIVDQWAFVGDLFRGGIVGSAASTHFYMCDLADNLADIERLLAEHPSVRTFFTGHFGPVDRAAVVAMVKERKSK